MRAHERIRTRNNRNRDHLETGLEQAYESLGKTIEYQKVLDDTIVADYYVPESNTAIVVMGD